MGFSDVFISLCASKLNIYYTLLVKSLFISDLHLSTSFDPKTYRYLFALVKKYQNVYILGDLFEGYKNNPSDVTNSEWGPFFDLLKTKKTYMFLGNHDNCSIQDLKDLNIFKGVYNQFNLKIGTKNYYLCHGHTYYPSLDMQFKCSLFPIWVTKILLKINGFEKTAKKGALRFRQQKDFNSYSQVDLKLLRRFKSNKNNNQILLCGHTHNPKFDLKNNYINTGFINYGFASYFVIDEKGELGYKTEAY